MTQLTLETFKKALKEGLDHGFEEQAMFINGASQTQKDHFDKLLVDLKKDMDQRFDKIDGRLEIVESKLDRALYTEVVHLEARLKRVEQKLGIKPAA